MRRKFGLFLMVAAMAPLAVASTAWACAALAKIKMSKKVVNPGETVAVTGTGFSDTHAGLTVGDSAVALRLKSRNGKILQQVNAVGQRIETTFTVPPSTPPGYYVLLATQTSANGTAKAGTPARYPFRVTGAAKRKSGAAAAWGGAPSAPSAPGGPSGSVAVAGGGVNGQTLLVGGLLSLTLLAAGTGLVARRNHSTTLSV